MYNHKNSDAHPSPSEVVTLSPCHVPTRSQSKIKNQKSKILRIAGVITLAFALVACAARKRYPDPDVGWHSADYSVLFGRISANHPAAPPTTPSHGPSALATPAAKPPANSSRSIPPNGMVGYTGGERVEIHGRRRTEPTNDNYNGRWYIVDAIRMWYGHR